MINAVSTLPDPKPVIIGHEVCPLTRQALCEGTFRRVVAHDITEMGRKAIEAALADQEAGIVACGIQVFVPENLPIS